MTNKKLARNPLPAACQKSSLIIKFFFKKNIDTKQEENYYR